MGDDCIPDGLMHRIRSDQGIEIPLFESGFSRFAKFVGTVKILSCGLVFFQFFHAYRKTVPGFGIVRVHFQHFVESPDRSIDQ
jgi:hypothetical protein